MTPLFVDAALLTSTLGSSTTLYQVASVKPRAFATATSAPAWVRDQQTAELYSVFHALRQGFLRGIPHICIVTDNVGTFLASALEKSQPTNSMANCRLCGSLLLKTLQTLFLVQ